MNKIGRPKLPTGRKKIKASTMLAPRLMDEAKEMAESLEITLSEFICDAIKRKVEQDGLRETSKIVAPIAALPTPPTTKRDKNNSAK